MNVLKEQFKQMLKSKCLSKAEKKYILKIVKDLINKREIMARNPVSFIEDSDFGQDFKLDSITGG